MEEIWKDVIGFERLYEVSDKGRIKSLDRVVVRGTSAIPQLAKRKNFKSCYR